MSESLAKTTCRIHFDRAASARCPGCSQFYCNECITEHDGKLTCASCLTGERTKVESDSKTGNGVLAWMQPMPLIHTLLALVLVWIVFYLVAQTLTSIPDQFHDGSILK